MKAKEEVRKSITGLLPGRTRRRAFLATLLTVAAISARAADWHLLVALGSSDAVIAHYDATTKAYLGPFVPKDSGGMGHPEALTIGPDGNLYAATCHSKMARSAA